MLIFRLHRIEIDSSLRYMQMCPAIRVTTERRLSVTGVILNILTRTIAARHRNMTTQSLSNAGSLSHV